MNLPNGAPGVTYKEIPDFPGYLVGDDGSVWSCRNTHGRLTDSWRRMKGSPKEYGHLRVKLRRGVNDWERLHIHSLVAELFIPRPVGKLEVCHDDGDPANNHVENLGWKTHKGNIADRDRHGRTARGELAGTSRLTTDQVHTIRGAYVEGAGENLARKYEVGATTIMNIVHRRTWKHLP